MKLRFNQFFFLHILEKTVCGTYSAQERTVEEFKVLNRFLLTSWCLLAQKSGSLLESVATVVNPTEWGSNCKLFRDAFSRLQVVIFLIPKTWENSKNSKNYWTFCLFHSKPGGLANSESSSLTGATAALVEGFQGMRWILRAHPWATFLTPQLKLHLYSGALAHFIYFSVGKNYFTCRRMCLHLHTHAVCACLCSSAVCLCFFCVEAREPAIKKRTGTSKGLEAQTQHTCWQSIGKPGEVKL